MQRKKKKKKSQKRIVRNRKKNIFLYFLIGTIFLIFALLITYPYFAIRVADASKIIYQKIPLPVVYIDNDKITTKDLYQNTQAVKHFYNSQDYSQSGFRVDFSTEKGKMRLRIKEKEVLNKMIEDIIIKKIAKNKGIIISNNDVDIAIKNSLEKTGSNYQKLSLSLKKEYNWSVDDFKNKVVKNQLYYKKLLKWYANSIKSSKKYKLAQKIREELIFTPDNFAEIVKKYSKEIDNDSETEVSWIKQKMIIPEVSQELAKMEVGNISKVIISPLGLHIIKMEGKKKNKDGSQEFKFKHIFIRGTNFIDWLTNQKNNFKIKVLLPEYQWDNNKKEIIFRNIKTREKEATIKAISQGDPSL